MALGHFFQLCVVADSSTSFLCFRLLINNVCGYTMYIRTSFLWVNVHALAMWWAPRALFTIVAWICLCFFLLQRLISLYSLLNLVFHSVLTCTRQESAESTAHTDNSCCRKKRIHISLNTLTKPCAPLPAWQACSQGLSRHPQEQPKRDPDRFSSHIKRVF